MSLVNRVLRDLSARAPAPVPAPLPTGLRLTPPPPPPPRPRVSPRAALVAAMLAGSAPVLWPLAQHHRPLAASPLPPAIAAPMPAPPAPPPLTRFKLDPNLSAPDAAVAPAQSAARPRHARPAALRLDGALASQPSPPAAAASAPAPVVAAPPAAAATPRDARQAEARFAEARRSGAAGEPRSAEQALREALALDPQLHAAREALVALLIDQRRLAEAQSALDDGLALEPARAPYRRLGARLDLLRGDPAAAVARLEPSPPSIAADPEYHGLLASAYQRLNRHEDAARLYQGLAQVQPLESHWWAGRGIALDALGDEAGALAAYAQARRLGGLEPALSEHVEKRSAALQHAG